MLTPEENKILSEMPETERIFVSAKYSKPIKDFNIFELEAECLGIVQNIMEAYSNKDQTEAVENIYKLLAKDLRKPKFLYVSMVEVSEACYRGVRREYGDFFAPTISIIHEWISFYLNSKDRKQALANFVIIQKEGSEVKTTEVPVHLKIEKSKEAVKNCFEEYRTNKRLPFFGFAYYEMLVDLKGTEYKGFKTLITDEEIRKLIRKKTEDAYTEKLIAQKSRCEKRGSFNEANAIMEEIITGFHGNKSLLKKQKELALVYYFDGLIANGKELEI